MNNVIRLVAANGEAYTRFRWHWFNLPFQDKMLLLVPSWKKEPSGKNSL
jgi:hypothetical protein